MSGNLEKSSVVGVDWGINSAEILAKTMNSYTKTKK